MLFPTSAIPSLNVFDADTELVFKFIHKEPLFCDVDSFIITQENNVFC